MRYTRNPGQDRARKELLTAGKRFCLVYGGSRSGKTFELVGTIAERALLAPGSRHLIVRQEGTSAKRAIVKGTWREVMDARFPGIGAEWHEQYGYFTFPNQSEVWVGGLNDEKALEKILGNEYSTIYMNEASESRYSAFTLLRSRLAQTVDTIQGAPLSQRFYVDLNPTTRQHWTYRLWIDGVEPTEQTPIDMDSYGHVVVNPFDNAANLSQEYLNDLRALPARARKRFFEGAYVEDVEDALWRRNTIRRVQQVPTMRRIVVAVDPAVTNEPGSDETGIIAAGVDFSGNGYVLEDGSGRHRAEDWARQAIAIMNSRGADRIVAEVNQGGDMVENTIRAIRQNVPYRAVRATRSKLIRAEPVAALYERGKIFHVGEFPQLEDQMCLVAGTMIETDRGQRPIEEIRPGEKVMTRAGYRSVEIACETGKVYSVVDIECSDGRVITCTRNHPIFVRGKFVPAENVRPGDSLFASPNWANTANQSHGADAGIIGWKRGISDTPRVRFFIGRYGRRTLGQFLTGIMSTIGTAIRATIDLRTLSACLPLSTMQDIQSVAGMGMNPYAAAGSNHGKHGNGSTLNAGSAAGLIEHPIQPGRAFARSLAGANTDPLKRCAPVGAPIAGTNLKHAIRGESIAVKRVTTRHITPESVYNLRVEGLPEYFANGILTHNCSFTTGFDRKAAGYSPDRVDALVWAFTDLFPELSAAPDDDWEEPDDDHSYNETTGY